MKNIKKHNIKNICKENGFSLITAILLVIILLICFIIYVAFNNGNNIDIDYENYFEEELSSTDNIALRYYYNQLNKPEQIMYTTMLENIDCLKNGTDPIKFPSSISDSIIEIGGNVDDNYFQSAWDALSLDNLNLFYIDTSNLSISTRTSQFLSYKSYGFTLYPQTGKTYYNSFFTNRVQIDEALEEVENIADDIIKNAKGSRYNKILYVHDWIVDNIDYDLDDTDNNDNIYGAFINKKAICEGYAESFKYLLDKMNIPCVLVYGNGIEDNGNQEAHAWNYVLMEDGKWYAVDTTWDDPIYEGGGIVINQNKYRYQYFLKGTETFNQKHINDGDVSGTGQNFEYPELSINDYAQGGRPFLGDFALLM